jgi:hypothetical protein
VAGCGWGAVAGGGSRLSLPTGWSWVRSPARWSSPASRRS